jgi:DNA-binding beta-propeller fold protein YncE
MRLRSLLLTVLCALGASALVPTVGAEAAVAPSHGLLFEIKKYESPPHSGRFETLEDPCGLAVDQSGKLYLSNYYSDQVAVLDSSGAGNEGELKGVEPLDGPCGLAIDPGGDLFVNDYHRNVTMFTAPWSTGSVIDAGNSPQTSPAIRPTGVARDPASGRIYVDDRTYIAAYEPSGAPVEVGSEPLQIGANPGADYYGLAASGYAASAGYLYVANAASGKIEVFDPATSTTTPVAEIDGEGAPGGGFNDLLDAALAIDATDGHLFVVDNVQGQFAEHPEAGLYEFNSQGEFRGQVLARELFDGEPSGLALAPPGAPAAGDLYITSGNSQPSKLFGLGPTGPARTLEVALAGEGEGVVTSQPAGIRCGGACTAEFNEGASVTLTATPAAGSALAGWSVSGSAPCPSAGTCTVSLASGVEAVAEFEPAPQPLAVLAPGGGEAPASQVAAAQGGAYSSAAAPAGAGAVTPSGVRSGTRHRHRKHRHHHRKGSVR